MSKIKKTLPKDIIDHWPEIFSDIELNVVPIRYLHAVRVEFHDGKIWDIDIEKSKLKDDIKEIERSLVNLLGAKQDSIKHIDFRLDVIQLKHDIQARTHTFLKKRR